MKKIGLLSFALLLVFLACSKVPLTHRKQLNLLPESQMLSMSLTEYQAFLSQHPPVSSSDANAQLVQKVGRNIQQGVEKYMQQQNLYSQIKDYKWEFNMVNSAEVNAWCMPGGKVVVYSGILPVTQDENGLAVVLGHEISHAIARHGNERMSQMLIAQGVGTGLDYALQNKPEQTKSIFMTAYGAGSTLGLLAYSRDQESEADKLGLVFMAMAGYDPQNAVTFWERMKAQSKSGTPPQFLSTHPSDDKRIKDIQKSMPMAMKYYSKK